MERRNNNTFVFEHHALELVATALDYCTILENVNETSRYDFIDAILRILPQLYIGGLSISKIEQDVDVDVELTDWVTEENYNIVRGNIAILLAEYDAYLDVFMEDMKYSDTPIATTISENLADIYQDMKNFVCAYRTEDERIMAMALRLCRENFEYYWGQLLTNVLRALHDVRFGEMEGNENY